MKLWRITYLREGKYRSMTLSAADPEGALAKARTLSRGATEHMVAEVAPNRNPGRKPWPAQLTLLEDE